MCSLITQIGDDSITPATAGSLNNQTWVNSDAKQSQDHDFKDTRDSSGLPASGSESVCCVATVVDMRTKKKIAVTKRGSEYKPAICIFRCLPTRISILMSHV